VARRFDHGGDGSEEAGLRKRVEFAAWRREGARACRDRHRGGPAAPGGPAGGTVPAILERRAPARADAVAPAPGAGADPGGGRAPDRSALDTGPPTDGIGAEPRMPSAGPLVARGPPPSPVRPPPPHKADPA